jgi:hypothetical protein
MVLVAVAAAALLAAALFWFGSATEEVGDAPVTTSARPPARASGSAATRRAPTVPAPDAADEDTGGVAPAGAPTARVSCSVDAPDQAVRLLAVTVDGGNGRAAGHITGGTLTLDVAPGDGQGTWRTDTAERIVAWRRAEAGRTVPCSVTTQREIGTIVGLVEGWDERWRGRVIGCGTGAALTPSGDFVMRAPAGPCTLHVERWVAGQIAEGPSVSLDVEASQDAFVSLDAPSEADARPLNDEELEQRAKILEVAKQLAESATGDPRLVDKLIVDLEEAERVPLPNSDTSE